VVAVDLSSSNVIVVVNVREVPVSEVFLSLQEGRT